MGWKVILWWFGGFGEYFDGDVDGSVRLVFFFRLVRVLFGFRGQELFVRSYVILGFGEFQKRNIRDDRWRGIDLSGSREFGFRIRAIIRGGVYGFTRVRLQRREVACLASSFGVWGSRDVFGEVLDIAGQIRGILR